MVHSMALVVVIFVILLGIVSSQDRGHPHDLCPDIPGADCSPGSAISFQAFPGVLKANVTSAASMRCALHNTNTSDDTAHIISILVTRGDGRVDVAEASSFEAAAPLADLNNLQVKGDVTGSSSEGYLELSWRQPSLMQTGDYECTITTMSKHHHLTEYKSSLTLTRVQPSLSDLFVVFQKQNAEITALQKTVSDQNTEISDQKQEILNLKQQDVLKTQQLDNQTQEIGVLKSCVKSRVVFMAVLSTSANTSITTGHPVVYDKVITNTDGGYDPHSGQFTVTTAGVYNFGITAVSSKPQICIGLYINSDVVTTVMSYDTDYDSASTTANVHLKTGDIVSVKPTGCGVYKHYHSRSVVDANVFTGQLLHNDACLL